MSKKFNADGPRILLVEGDNDGHVISALCQHYNVPEHFGIYTCGSDEEVIKKLNALLSTEGKEAIGVVLDADNPDLAGKWQTFRGKLKQKNILVTDNKPDENGTIIPAVKDEHPRIRSLVNA